MARPKNKRAQQTAAAETKFKDDVRDGFISGFDYSATILWNASVYLGLALFNPVISPIFIGVSLLAALIVGYRTFLKGKKGLPKERVQAQKEHIEQLLQDMLALQSKVITFFPPHHPTRNQTIKALDQLEIKARKQLEEITNPREIATTEIYLALKETNKYQRWGFSLLALIGSYLMGFWLLYVIRSFILPVATFTSLGMFLWPLLLVGLTAVGIYYYQKNREYLYNNLAEFEKEKMRAIQIALISEQLVLEKDALERNMALSLSNQAFDHALKKKKPLTSEEKLPWPSDLAHIPIPMNIVPEEEQAGKKIHFWPKVNMMIAFLNGVVTVAFAQWVVSEYLTIALGSPLTGTALLGFTFTMVGLGIALGVLLAYLQLKEIQHEEDAIGNFKRKNNATHKIGDIEKNKKEIIAKLNHILLLTEELDKRIKKFSQHLPEGYFPSESLEWMQGLATLLNPPPEEVTGWFATAWLYTKKATHRIFEWTAKLFTAAIVVRWVIGIYATFAGVSAAALVVSPVGIGLFVTAGLIFATFTAINTFHLSREKGKTIEAITKIDLTLEQQKTVLQILDQKDKNLRDRITKIDAVAKDAPQVRYKIFHDAHEVKHEIKLDEKRPSQELTHRHQTSHKKK